MPRKNGPPEAVNGIDPVAFAQALIRCRSVTPDEGGALNWLEAQLKPRGFDCHRLVFSTPGTPDVDNLYARLGSTGPHLCFAGHTDVVPPGDEAQWRHPPFDAVIDNGTLYGRGAVDMKGAIACFLAAALRHLDAGSPLTRGSISFLITGDEEGPSVNGTRKVLDWLKARGETLDHCIVGEPSNPNQLGDEIKIGRRGSLNGWLTVRGTQGHVAYPQLANNPIPGLVAVLHELLALRLDDGAGHFAASKLEVTTIDVANPTVNIIPAEARARINIRYNDRHTAQSLETMVQGIVEAALASSGLDFELTFSRSGDAFLTRPDKPGSAKLIDQLRQAVIAVTGREPALTTSGGTSDARFIKDLCPVIEFGLVNATIHQLDERTSVADLEPLTRIYQRFLASYFAHV